ncbi:phenylalanine 4-monooxygenase [Candidatus Kaiserbacteria bacterium]|nr:phenylalanine 4-monooxygenase [Candidatus Kaiserbacteria bacterium]
MAHLIKAALSANYTIDQRWKDYTKGEHDTWRLLAETQERVLLGRACEEYMNGLSRLPILGKGIPDFRELSEVLYGLTGWRVVAVPGLVPDGAFFDYLARRIFPAGQFIRNPRQLKYLQEPDVFHDVFGHGPLLADPTIADYMEAYGRGGLKVLHQPNRLKELARLYWYTIEFGLQRTKDGLLRIYGAGILSSSGESVFSLESHAPYRIDFDLERVMRTKYQISSFQDVYFVISNLKDLMEVTLQDFESLYGSLVSKQEIEIGLVYPYENDISPNPKLA